jgi:uncharacterized membrane protein YqiK
MIKTRYVLASLAGTAAITLGAIGAVSADTPNNSSGNIGNSGILRTTFRQDRLNAVAQVLNTTTANIKTAHSNKDLEQLISNSGLTRKTFREKVKSNVTSELKAQGYTQSQITAAFQHKHHFNHHKK